MSDPRSQPVQPKAVTRDRGQVEPQVKGQPTNVKNRSLRSVAALKSIGDDELSNVSGGGAAHADFHVMKLVDKASPKLYEAACKGTHLPEVTIEMAR
jgi:type VI protein secretion system component Hcp